MKIFITVTIVIAAILLVPIACSSPAATPPASQGSPAAVQTTVPASPAAPAPEPAATVPIGQPPVPATAPAAAPAVVPAPMKPADPSAITYKELKIAPGTVKVGEITKVSVSVTNTGGPLNFPVELKVDGKVVDEQALTCKIDIDCDETKLVNFDLRMASSGTYTVSVGDQTSRLVVQ